MNFELIKKIVFWTLTVFVAGLIGYFGRYIAMMIIGCFKKKKNKIIEKNNDYNSGKDRLKAEKKISKNEYKLRKKLNKKK